MSGDGWAASRRRERLPADWPKRRARVLRRDAGICHVCHGGGADGVDHLIPGDDHDEANLAAIHHNVWPYCHRVKSAREGGHARQAPNALRKRPAEPHPGLLP